MQTKKYVGYKKALLLSLIINGFLIITVASILSVLSEPHKEVETKLVKVDMANYAVQKIGNSNDGFVSTERASTGRSNGTSSNNNGMRSNQSPPGIGETPRGFKGNGSNNDVGSIGASGQQGYGQQGYISGGNGGGATGGGSGSGESGDGNGGTEGEGSGGGSGNGNEAGYVDIDGYIARLNVQAANSYPSQARRQNRQGTVVFSVTFDADGNVVAIEKNRSSGTPSLDTAAEHQIRTGGAIGNTTGASTTQIVTIRYVL